MGRSARGILAIATGAAGGQIIGLIVTPMVSRIYGPEVYGDFALIQSVASVLLPMATLRLPFAMLRPKNGQTVKTVLVIGLILSGLIALLASLTVYVVSVGLELDTVAASHSGAFWIFMMTWATAIFSYLSQAALRAHQYKTVGMRHVTQHGTAGVSQITFGLVSSVSHVGLSAGRVLGLLASCVLLVRPSLKYWRAKGWTRPLTLIKDFWRYPLLFTPSALLNVLGTQMPILLVTAAYTSDVVGQLGMAQRVALIPSGLIGMAVSQVFASEVAARLRSGEKGIRRQFLSFAGRLGILAVIVGVTLFVFGPWAIPFFLGEDWVLAGEFTRVMALSIAFGIVVTPLSTVFLIADAAVASITVDAVRVMLLFVAYNFAVNSAPTPVGPVEMVLYLYGALALSYLVTFLVAYWVVKKEETAY